jgi:hypothetical protein
LCVILCTVCKETIKWLNLILLIHKIVSIHHSTCMMFTSLC